MAFSVNFFDFMTFLSKISFHNNSIISGGHNLKTGPRGIFFFVLKTFVHSICVYPGPKKKILSARRPLNFDLYIPLFLGFFDPNRPIMGSTPTFAFSINRGPRVE